MNKHSVSSSNKISAGSSKMKNCRTLDDGSFEQSDLAPKRLKSTGSSLFEDQGETENSNKDLHSPV